MAGLTPDPVKHALAVLERVTRATQWGVCELGRTHAATP